MFELRHEKEEHAASTHKIQRTYEGNYECKKDRCQGMEINQKNQQSAETKRYTMKYHLDSKSILEWDMATLG